MAHTLTVPGATENVQVELSTKPLFIVGRNGSGKSALVHHLRQQLASSFGQNLIYLPGSRTSYFDGESLNMTPNARSSFMSNSLSWDSSPDIRIRPISGTQRNERAIYDLQAGEIQYAVDAAMDIKSNGFASASIHKLQSELSPVDRVNSLLSQANLPIRCVIEGGELKASRSGNVYSIARMSDGERAALIIISEVISAKPGSCLLIDEPELHLHPAIVVPLIGALVRERPDCSMIVSTHELRLPSENPQSGIIVVRGSSWQNSFAASWEIDYLPSPDLIPEQLRVDLLGSRRKILFVEGTRSSLDQPLYSLLFPNASIRQKESCTEVRRAVNGLVAVYSEHHAEVFGLVDNDSMSEAFKLTLLSEKVHALPVFSVESLYYCEEAVAAVATRQSANLGVPADDLSAEAAARALGILRQPGKVEHLASRVAERRLRDQILSSLPTREEMIASGDAPISFSFASDYVSVFSEYSLYVDNGDVWPLIIKSPVRETGALDAIAKALRFQGTSDYERAFLVAVEKDADLKNLLLSKLGGLVAALC
jgi:hypothetical protein